MTSARPHSMLSAEPAKDCYRSHCSVTGCHRSSGRHVFVCHEHWLLIHPGTRTMLVALWERYAGASPRDEDEIRRDAIVRFYSIARHGALPQIRANLAAGPLELAEAQP